MVSWVLIVVAVAILLGAVVLYRRKCAEEEARIEAEEAKARAKYKAKAEAAAKAAKVEKAEKAAENAAAGLTTKDDVDLAAKPSIETVGKFRAMSVDTKKNEARRLRDKKKRGDLDIYETDMFMLMMLESVLDDGGPTLNEAAGSNGATPGPSTVYSDPVEASTSSCDSSSSSSDSSSSSSGSSYGGSSDSGGYGGGSSDSGGGGD